MKLYHGTTGEVGLLVKLEGLKPRSHTKRSNWEHTTESHPDMVYLTDVYATHFALCAGAVENNFCAIVEVETDRLDQKLFRPDEDFIAQVQKHNGAKDSLAKLTRMARRHWQKYAHPDNWQRSVKALGTCAYQGVIPRSAITRISFFDMMDVPPVLRHQIQPTITLVNHQFCAAKYAMLNRWFMGDPVTAEEMIDSMFPGGVREQFEKLDPAGFAKQLEALREALVSQGRVISGGEAIPC